MKLLVTLTTTVLALFAAVVVTASYNNATVLDKDPVYEAPITIQEETETESGTKSEKDTGVSLYKLDRSKYTIREDQTVDLEIDESQKEIEEKDKFWNIGKSETSVSETATEIETETASVVSNDSGVAADDAPAASDDWGQDSGYYEDNYYDNSYYYEEPAYYEPEGCGWSVSLRHISIWNTDDYVNDDKLDDYAYINEYASIGSWYVQWVVEAVQRNSEGEIVDLSDLGDEFDTAIYWYKQLTGDYGILDRNEKVANVKTITINGVTKERTDGYKLLIHSCSENANVTTYSQLAEDRKYIMQKSYDDVYNAVINAGIYDGMDQMVAFKKIVYYVADHAYYSHNGECRNFYNILQNGSGVCAAYAQLVRDMCYVCGIECESVYGYAGGGYHQWNCVNLGGTWYYSDATWYDCYGDSYYLLSSSDFYDHYAETYSGELFSVVWGDGAVYSCWWPDGTGYSV